jgi:hypothetical protein
MGKKKRIVAPQRQHEIAGTKEEVDIEEFANRSGLESFIQRRFGQPVSLL